VFTIEAKWKKYQMYKYDYNYANVNLGKVS